MRFISLGQIIASFLLIIDLIFIKEILFRNLDLFTSDLQLLKNCVKIYQSNFTKFTRNFLLKNPDLLNILVNSLMVFAGKMKKKEKKDSVAMVLSKKAKEKKNKIMNVISLNESIKQVNPFEYLQGVEKKTLNKFIIKALKGFIEFFLIFKKILCFFSCFNRNSITGSIRSRKLKHPSL